MGRELIEKVFQKFENHLNIENNNRVVFSGKFGIGKSYFLDEFFKDEKYQNEYFPICLNPVNYSVSSNQDIFELIKFDILFQILDNNVVDFVDFDFQTGNLVYHYFSNKFLNDFISNVDSIGETVIEDNLLKSYSIIKSIGKLISKISEVNKTDFDNFKKEVEANPDLKVIKEFFDREELKIGSLYENNAVSQIICKLTKGIEAKYEKKTVLVIDDLDRIDPEHIFRILNIFSAHDKLGENKFGFEKVILVCDINNIRHIYHHFYGEHVDFFGYINKFYSLEIFDYTNKDYLKAFYNNFEIRNVHFDEAKKLEFFKFIFSEAIENNFITARQLFSIDFSSQNILKRYNFYANVDLNRASYHGKSVNNFSSFRIPYVLTKTLLYFFGDEKTLLIFMSTVEKENLLYFKELFISFLMFSELKVVNEANINFKVRGVSLKSNNYLDYEITDYDSIKTLNINEIFIDIIKITREMIIKH